MSHLLAPFFTGAVCGVAAIAFGTTVGVIAASIVKKLLRRMSAMSPQYASALGAAVVALVGVEAAAAGLVCGSGAVYAAMYSAPDGGWSAVWSACGFWGFWSFAASGVTGFFLEFS